MKNELFELFNDTYKQTVKDNQEDFLKVINIISKLCAILISKNILNAEELNEILDIDKNIIDLESKGE